MKAANPNQAALGRHFSCAAIVLTPCTSPLPSNCCCRCLNAYRFSAFAATRRFVERSAFTAPVLAPQATSKSNVVNGWKADVKRTYRELHEWQETSWHRAEVCRDRAITPLPGSRAKTARPPARAEER